MIRSELVKKVANNTGYDAEVVDIILKDITNEITQQLSMNNSVGIHGFGKFVARAYCERKCYNPITGEIQMISPSIQPAFIPGTKMRDEINKK